jgi:hypothetical protein
MTEVASKGGEEILKSEIEPTLPEVEDPVPHSWWKLTFMAGKDEKD